ncbi:ribosome biogenesis protein bop1 [Caerostris extrusa]|uniref:Ribosome biogenesis protein bop1 n=1 Tax=Caerostris extrusa TaxID=172846 RepID=A0AAV4X9M5_CAEEX|nr:ribosome biogenesis protein bop1 [Caerostris extrusa]
MKVEKKNPKKVSEPEEDSDSSVYSDLEESSESDSEVSEDENESSDDQNNENEIQNGKVDNSESIHQNDTSDNEMNNNQINEAKSQNVSNVPKIIKDEYEIDTSDEEDIRNTVGNIPMKWYDEFPHIGYDVDGKKILKPATNDEIDEFLSKIDDPNYWRTVKNKMTGEKVVLTDEDLDIIQRLQSGKYPTSSVQYEPFEDFFTYEVMEHPVTNQPPHKRSFIPSKLEKEKVSKLVYAIKMGWIKPRAPKEEKDPFYMLWDKDVAEESKRLQHYIPAPKRKLPGHEESYNPPAEYLFTKEEVQKR